MIFSLGLDNIRDLFLKRLRMCTPTFLASCLLLFFLYLIFLFSFPSSVVLLFVSLFRSFLFPGQPDAVVFLGQDAVTQLEEIGASRIRHLAAYEAWAMVSHTPTRLAGSSASSGSSNNKRANVKNLVASKFNSTTTTTTATSNDIYRKSGSFFNPTRPVTSKVRLENY